MRKPRWTEREESILVREIQQTPYNLNDAFRRTSSSIGRSPKAVELHWYLCIAKKPDVPKMFMTVGRNNLCINRKNVTLHEDSTVITSTRNIWRRILNFLGL